MSPEERRNSSEALLKEHGTEINPTLPPIEGDDEVEPRSAEEVLRRLLALWIVVAAAFQRGNHFFRQYILERKFESWLSAKELEFMLNDKPTEEDYTKFTWQLECLYFLAWCAGLIDKIEIPVKQSDVESIEHLFPRAFDEEPDILRRALVMRDKDEIMAWADLLYRLHWAVRNTQLLGTPPPPNLEGGVVQEWHQAVNWMIRYEGEDNWDNVGTDT